MQIITSNYTSVRIEKKQERLNELFLEKGQLVDPEVVALSQELDQIIVSVQKKTAPTF